MSLNKTDNNISLFIDKQSNSSAYNARINTFSKENVNRLPLENFINKIFNKYYNVEIEKFYPQLIAIESPDNNINDESSIKAVAGVRCAAEESLFSEYYLTDNLETELNNIYHKSISRQAVVEVGNLAPENIGQMRWLIAAITAYLYSAGYEYLVFTAVPSIYNSFKRMDMPVTIMAEANLDCLPKDIKQHWGSEYYAHKPVVITGDIVKGFTIMKQNIYTKNQKIIPLFEKACHLGQQRLLDGEAA